MNQPVHPLVEVSEHVAQEARRSRVAVVFDLDSTLFCVSPRTQHILRSLGEQPEFSSAHGAVAEVLRKIEVLPTDYSVREVLARATVEPDPDVALAIRAHWKKYFFTSEFLDRDILYPSANEYVNHLHDLGAEILYLTGRHEAAMREGTISALKRENFPLFDDGRLIMKPTDLETDEYFKVKVLREISPKYDHVWFFENEPVIIEEVRQAVPHVHVVFVNSAHSGKKPAPVGLRTITPNFHLPRK